MILDDLELELRKLPGVQAAGFDSRDELLLIQLQVQGGSDPTEVPLPVAATRIASRHSDRPVAVEIVRWRNPARGSAALIGPAEEPAPAVPAAAAPAVEAAPGRPRLLAVLSFPDTDEIEVHLILVGKRTIGRAAASKGLVGAVEATIDALRGFVDTFTAEARWAKALESDRDDAYLVAAALDCGDEYDAFLYGLSGGSSAIDAAARATLDALNRRVTRLLRG